MPNQKTAIIDLAKREVIEERISPELRRRFLGGRGINVYLLFNHTTAFMDPLSAEAPFLVGAGLLSGLPCPSASRCSITGKSPETRLLGDSNIGGFVASELRKTGYDHLLIKGRASTPIYLLINETGIHFVDAGWLWGKDTIETTELLKEREGETCQVLCIGQAGENQVRFACVRHGAKSAAGRGGLGCLMGSKKLKAIVLHGKQAPMLYDRQALLQYSKTLNKRLLASKTTKALHKYGTPFLYDIHNFKGIIRTHNGRFTQFKAGKRLRASSLKDRYHASSSCFGCVIGCRHKYRMKTSSRKEVEAEGPEYGTLAAFGPICGITDPDTIFEINHRVNRYGLDSVSTGNMIAWAIELFEEGILTEKETFGQKLQWGDQNIILELIDQMAYREGFGNTLADGPRAAVELFGPQAERFLNWGKYLIQSDSVDVRAHKGFALSVATATRGADHLRSRPTLEALSLTGEQLEKIYGSAVSPDHSAYEGKARMVWWSECEFALADALGICRFAQRFNSIEHLNIDELKNLVYYATGLEFSADEFFRAGERITTLERMFLVREGIRRKDDSLPARYYEPLPSGKFKGETIDPLKFDRMLDEYYSLHGWDTATGIPTPKRLIELGIEHSI